MIIAFIPSCPIPQENQPSNCSEIIIQSPPENPITIAHLEAIQFLSYRSMDLFAPLYLGLMAIGIFRRYILARI